MHKALYSLVRSRRDHPAGFSILPLITEETVDARRSALTTIACGYREFYRNTAPVAFATAATTFCAEVSISASARV